MKVIDFWQNIDIDGTSSYMAMWIVSGMCFASGSAIEFAIFWLVSKELIPIDFTLDKYAAIGYVFHVKLTTGCRFAISVYRFS